MQRLDGSTTLLSGQRLRVRIPQRADVPRIRDLLTRLGVSTDDLQLSRGLRFDPLERVAVVATTLIDRSEAVVGLAAMDLFAEDPDLVLADERGAPGARSFLEASLRAHGRRVRRSA